MRARVIDATTVDWIEPPGHEGSYSKLLVNPENSETQYLDVRVSITRPQGAIEPHSHAEAENVYYVIQGTGVIDLDGVRQLVRPGIAVFIAPGVRHALYNTGFENLVTLFVGCPATDMHRSPKR